MNRENSSLQTFPPTLLYRLLAFGALCLLMPALFLAYQWSTPSDGARFSKEPGSITAAGIYAHPLRPDSELKDGDLVVAIEGVSLGVWIGQAVNPNGWNEVWNTGDLIVYSVIRNGEPVEVPVTLGKQPILNILKENWGVLTFAVVFQIVAGFVAVRRYYDPAARALFIWAFTCAHFYLWSSFLQYYDIVNGFGYWSYQLPATFLWLANWGASLHLALVFPARLPPVQRHPRLVWMAYLFTFVIFLIWVGISRLLTANVLLHMQYWWSGEFIAAIITFFPVLFIMIAQYSRFRHGPEQAKIKWIVFSAIFSGSLAVILYLLPEYLGLPSLGVNIVGLLLLPFPVAIAIAIWRHKLFDIDLIIHRTLVYSALTVTLALVYYITVILVGQVISLVTGEEGQSTLAIVLTTLLIAALFNPLRQRIQKTIDRRFFRERYDSSHILEEYSARLRDEVDLDELCKHLLKVVEATLKPEHASLWLKQVPKKKQSSGS